MNQKSKNNQSKQTLKSLRLLRKGLTSIINIIVISNELTKMKK
jgi:hypothetical protein